MNRETCLADCWDWVSEVDVAAVLPEAFAYARDCIAMPEQFDGKPNVFDDDGLLWASRGSFAHYLAAGVFRAVARLAAERGIALDQGFDVETTPC